MCGVVIFDPICKTFHSYLNVNGKWFWYNNLSSVGMIEVDFLKHALPSTSIVSSVLYISDIASPTRNCCVLGGSSVKNVCHSQKRVCSDLGAVDSSRPISNDDDSHLDMRTDDTVMVLSEVLPESSTVPLPTHNSLVYIVSSESLTKCVGDTLNSGIDRMVVDDVLYAHDQSCVIRKSDNLRERSIEATIGDCEDDADPAVRSVLNKTAVDEQLERCRLAKLNSDHRSALLSKYRELLFYLSAMRKRGTARQRRRFRTQTKKKRRISRRLRKTRCYETRMKTASMAYIKK